jgi:hypothetical protein
MTRTGVASAQHVARRRDVALEAMWCMALDSALAKVVAALARRGVHPLLLKGPSFARWLYDDPTERPYGDIDLLIAPAEFEAAQRVVSELGFAPARPPVKARETPGHHEVWRSSGNADLRLELHRTVPLVAAAPSLLWRRFSEEAETLGVAGAQVKVPGEAARALMVALHAAQHGAGVTKPRSDLDRALARVEPVVWQEAAALARELGAAPAFAVGLSLSPLGRDQADRLGLSAGAASRAVRLRAGGAPGTAIAFDRFVEQLLSTHGLRARIRLVGRQMVPSRAWMRAGYPIARRSRRGLAVAYAVRPIRVATMLPSGLRAWLRVARPRRARETSKRE